MREYLSPGVYVEEYDNSPGTVESAGTSTAGFIGMTERGNAGGEPVLITGFSQFLKKFGGYLSSFTHGEYRYLPISVEQFFTNGGTRCYISRVIPEDAKKALKETKAVILEASNEGKWGNRIRVTFKDIKKKKMQVMEKKQGEDGVYIVKSTEGFKEGDIVFGKGRYNKIVSIFDNVVTMTEPFAEDIVDNSTVPQTLLYLSETDITVEIDGEREEYRGVTFNVNSENYIGERLKKSSIVNIVSVNRPEKPMSITEAIFGEEIMEGTITLEGGSDGSIEKVTAETFIGEDKGPGKRTGIQSFMENDTVSIMAVPGIAMPEVMVALVSHCENMANRFAIFDMPCELSDVKELLEYREIIDTTYGAMYHPWISVYDKASKKPSFIPPSGAVAGVYAKTDISRGVHKAPANETILCTGVRTNYTSREQDILNPEGINLIRSISGMGIRIWGARTAGSSSAFRYVNVRRLFIYVEESIKKSTGWVVFEPNDNTLWSRVSMTITSFLDNMYRMGMFAGATPEESYFVEIGTSTMTPDDIRAGRLICNVGIAPSRPAEFVIFRVTQYTAEAAE